MRCVPEQLLSVHKQNAPNGLSDRPGPAAIRNRANAGQATILFVEDEPALRMLAKRILERQGYQVRDAATGTEALEIWKNHKSNFDVLVTDMMMPAGLSGEELARTLTSEKPELKVLYVSGYGYDPLRGGSALAQAEFLGKPYAPTALLAAVGRALAC